MTEAFPPKIFPFYRLAFARIDRELRIREVSPNLEKFVDVDMETIHSRLVCEVLVELVGLDLELHKIINGELPSLLLNNVNRVTQEGTLCYLNIHIGLYDESDKQAGLLLVIEDVTRSGRVEQALAQDRNELHLLKRQVATFSQELARYAFVDSLTGLSNRRFLYEELERLFQRLQQKQIAGFALLFLDIDNFKIYNDTYGHLVGDRLVQAVAQTLRYHIRQFDTACRYGGDEFAIIMPNLPIRHALEICDRLLSAVHHNQFILKFLKDNPITFSIGLALAPRDANDSDELMHAADQALYHAKKNGKNRTVIYDASISQLKQIDSNMN